MLVGGVKHTLLGADQNFGPMEYQVDNIVDQDMKASSLFSADDAPLSLPLPLLPHSRPEYNNTDILHLIHYLQPSQVEHQRQNALEQHTFHEQIMQARQEDNQRFMGLFQAFARQTPCHSCPSFCHHTCNFYSPDSNGYLTCSPAYSCQQAYGPSSTILQQDSTYQVVRHRRLRFEVYAALVGLYSLH